MNMLHTHLPAVAPRGAMARKPSPSRQLPAGINERRRRKQRVLLLPLEFFPWHRARPWTYAAQLAFEEGFAAQGIDVVTLPALCEVPSSAPGAWLSRFDELIGRQRFDQVWIWLCHAEYDDALMQRLTSLAPVRVGVLMESLQYTMREKKAHPYFHAYEPTVIRQSKTLTHIVTADEVDAVDLKRLTSAETLWWPGTVPSRLLSAVPETLPETPAAFIGALYGERARWFKNPRLRRLLTRPPSPDDASECPHLFNRLFINAHEYLESGATAARTDLDEFVTSWRVVRRRAFETYLAGLQQWSAVVALPSYVKTYAGRVVEGMAIGRPVVSWNIPRRPRNRALFVDGHEILLYPRKNPDALADALKSLQRNPEWARRVAIAGQEKIRRYHTIEARIAQVLQWIEDGHEPDYGEGHSAPRTSAARPIASPVSSRVSVSLPAVNGSATALPTPRVAARWIQQVLATAPCVDDRRRRLKRTRRVLAAGCPLDWEAELRALSPTGRIALATGKAPWRARSIGPAVPQTGTSRNADVLLWSGAVPSQPGEELAEFAVTLHNLVAPGGRVVLLNEGSVTGARRALRRLGFVVPPLGGELDGRVLQRDSAKEPSARSAPTSPASMRMHAVRTTIVHPSIALITLKESTVVVHEWERRISELRAAATTRALVCWGTGARARALMALLDTVDMEFSACVDGDEDKVGSTFAGLNVHSPRWLQQQLANGTPVFVVIASMFVAEISRRLKRLGAEPTDFMAL